MKKILILSLAILSILFTSCNKGKINELENEITNLKHEKHVADSLQNKFYMFLNEIESNLNEIKTRERIISDVAGERPRNMQEKILQDLSDINDLMEKNRARLNELESLRRQLRAANANIQNLQHLQKMIDSLTLRIEEQEKQLKDLQERLRIATHTIEVLRVEKQEVVEESERRQAKIDEQTIELNTAFWTMGTSRSLRDAGVTTSKGGFIGIGRTEILNDDASLQNFKRIDIREFSRLETNSERIEIITVHAPESFTINNSDRKNLVIEITNPALFWKSSKFLVVRIR